MLLCKSQWIIDGRTGSQNILSQKIIQKQNQIIKEQNTNCPQIITKQINELLSFHKQNPGQENILNKNKGNCLKYQLEGIKITAFCKHMFKGKISKHKMFDDSFQESLKGGNIKVKTQLMISLAGGFKKTKKQESQRIQRWPTYIYSLTSIHKHAQK